MAAATASVCAIYIYFQDLQKASEREGKQEIQICRPWKHKGFTRGVCADTQETLKPNKASLYRLFKGLIIYAFLPSYWERLLTFYLFMQWLCQGALSLGSSLRASAGWTKNRRQTIVYSDYTIAYLWCIACGPLWGETLAGGQKGKVRCRTLTRTEWFSLPYM